MTTMSKEQAVASADYDFEDLLNELKVKDYTDASLERHAKAFVEKAKEIYGFDIAWRWSCHGGIEFY